MATKTVLIIEDNDDIRESTAEILELAGYQVMAAANGRDGVDAALKARPDIILCDIMMPVMDGYGVLYLLGKHEETAHIPFIFLTAKAERADIRKGMDMGADDYLTKPFDDVELLNAVEIRLRKRAGNDAGASYQSRMTEQEQLKLLSKLEGRHKTYRKRQVIYQAGDAPLYVYRVKSGKVRSFLFYQDGRELSTGIFTAGDYLGYEAVLQQAPHTDNAETLEDTELLLINKDDFFDLLYKNPGVARKFIQLLSGNIREKEEQLLRLAYHSVRKKVADALVSISLKFRDDPAADECLVQISRDDLAAMAGTANETVSRMLADFRDENLISKEGNAIRLHSIERLKNIRA